MPMIWVTVMPASTKLAPCNVYPCSVVRNNDRCAITEPTTSSAEAWPSARYQNAEVRSAWLAVRWTADSDTACRPTAGGGSSMPSIGRPCSAGLEPNIRDSTRVTAPRISPDSTAVVRQPRWVSATTTSGANSPPAAMPRPVSDSAFARRRSNQRTTSVLTVMNPDSPAPMAMTKNDTTNPTGVEIWLNHTNPITVMTAPSCITRLVPKRCSAQPWSGPSSPLSARLNEYATEIVVLDQPNRSWSTTA